MSLVKFNYGPMTTLFEDFLGRDSFETPTFRSVPATNIKETESDFQIELSVPGFKKEDVKIEQNESQLIISAEMNAENVENNGKYSRREFKAVSFKRAFNLPQEIKHDEISAKHENGVLLIIIPKRVEERNTAKRVIEIA